MTTLTPTRRGDRPAVRVTVRSYGPLRFAYRQTTRRRSAALTPPWTLRVLPPFHSRRLPAGEAVPAAGHRRPGGDPRPGPGHRVRLPARVRDRRRHPLDRLAGHAPGPSTWWSSTWRPERDRRVLCVLDTGRTSAGPGRRRAPPGRRDRRRAAASRAGRPRRRPGRPARRRHRGTRRRLHAAASQARCPSWSTRWPPLEPALVGDRLRTGGRRGAGAGPAASTGGVVHHLEPGALGEGLLPVLPQLARPAPGDAGGGARSGAGALAAGRGSPRRSTPPRRPSSGAGRAAPGPAALPGTGSTWWTRQRPRSPRRSPTPTWTSRPPAGSEPAPRRTRARSAGSGGRRRRGPVQRVDVRARPGGARRDAGADDVAEEPSHTIAPKASLAGIGTGSGVTNASTSPLTNSTAPTERHHHRRSGPARPAPGPGSGAGRARSTPSRCAAPPRPR